MRFRRMLLLAGCAALVVAPSAGSVLAQDVIVADSSSGRISVFTPSGSSLPFNVNTEALERPFGIALDNAGGLIVADNERNRILRYEPGEGGHQLLASRVPAPDGPSIGPNGDIFFVSSPTGIRRSRSVYMIPGGSGPRTLVATIPRSDALRETAVVPMGPYAGHLLVLSEKPGFIARFAPDGAGGWSREADFVTALPGMGTGMDFTLTGELLVSGTQGTLRLRRDEGSRLPGLEEPTSGWTSGGRSGGYDSPALAGTEGVVWRFDEVGNRLSDFATGLPVGSTRVAAGADGTVYLTNRYGPNVAHFSASGQRMPDLSGGLEAPVGVATQVLVPTPVGTNVMVQLLNDVAVVFDRVTTAGFTSAEQVILTLEDSVTPCGNTLPAFILPPSTGPFTATKIQTTAFHTDTIEVIQDHPAGDSRLFHAGCGGDSPGFEDTTTLAIPGDPRGRVITFSEFVVGSDPRDNGAVIALKLAQLESYVAIDSGVEACIDPQLLATLRQSLSEIHTLVVGDNTQEAFDALQVFKTLVRQSSGPDGIPNSAQSPCGNVAGGLVASASTLSFSLSLYLPL